MMHYQHQRRTVKRKGEEERLSDYIGPITIFQLVDLVANPELSLL
jgi:hypothetical protein